MISSVTSIPCSGSGGRRGLGMKTLATFVLPNEETSIACIACVFWRSPTKFAYRILVLDSRMDDV